MDKNRNYDDDLPSIVISIAFIVFFAVFVVFAIASLLSLSTVNFDREASTQKTLLEQQSQTENGYENMPLILADIAATTIHNAAEEQEEQQQQRSISFINDPIFDGPINLTNNTRDSVYAQVAAYRNK
jgi:hypothetical protein